MNSSFLQSKEWMEFQKSLGRQIFSFEGNISAKVVKHEGGLGKNYLFLPHAPEIDFNAMQGGSKNPARQFISQLRDLAKREQSIFIKAEPLSGAVVEVLMENGFKRSKKEVMPHKTVVIDLAKSEEELLTAMHHKTRYNIKVAEKHGIIVEDSKDIDVFWKLMQKTTKRDKFNPHPKEYYKKLLEFFGDGSSIKVELVLARHGNKPVAGALILLYGETAYYLHGASDHEYRSMMAPYLLHWENIKYLKEHGHKTYDLWGIDSAKWPGVTRFKLGWGGEQINYPGSFDLPIRRGWYLIYKTHRAIYK